MGVLVLVRHGQTDWSRTGRHTGASDPPLDADGERQAAALRRVLDGYRFRLVVTSPRQRARRTAELAGLPDGEIDGDLAEWDYGDYDGLTTEQIQQSRPGWYLWTDGVPGGETLAEVSARADRVLERVRTTVAGGDVALVGHGHALRVLAARWVGQPPDTGSRLRLDAGTCSVLAHEHGRATIDHWNLRP